MNAEATRVIAGLDEAGLGPLLGPMTLGWCAFRVPRGDFDLWARLRRIVRSKPREDGQYLIVADSKRVFSRNPRGARRLETTVLSFLAQLDGQGRWPSSGAELLRLAPPELAPRPGTFEAHPWYALLAGELPARVPADRLALRSAQLGRELDRSGASLLEAGLRVVPSGELNRSWRETGNKAASQWRLTGAILRYLWRSYAEGGVTVFVDRLGGRQHYAPLLGRLLPGAAVHRHSESTAAGEYRIVEGRRRMRVVFAARAEERAFTVALASCLAKYGRELVMEAFNRYFEDLQPGLRPTAGYTTDGRRWLSEAGPALERAAVEPGLLVRER